MKSENIFIGKTDAPTGKELADALGRAKPVWDQLLADLDARLLQVESGEKPEILTQDAKKPEQKSEETKA